MVESMYQIWFAMLMMGWVILIDLTNPIRNCSVFEDPTQNRTLRGNPFTMVHVSKEFSYYGVDGGLHTFL